MTFGDKLRELREDKGWSQAELAAKSGTSQAGITKWEAGIRVPGLDAVHKLCKALGVRCTSFDDCKFEEAEAKRRRGRPPKT